MEHEIDPRHQGVTYINDFGSDTNLAIVRLLGWHPQPVKTPMPPEHHFPPALVEEARRNARATQLQRELHEQAAMYGLI